MNHFDHQKAANWYARGRPYFHPLVMERARRFLGLDSRLPEALDVACGTGQSALALKELAKRVTAIDPSRQMLSQAPENPRIRYIEAPAEYLPFGRNSFDLATVALALHWLDRECFLREIRRVLHPSGWLIVYDNAFTGKMEGNPEFERWYWDEWMQYPSPASDRTSITGEQVRKHGLRLVGEEEYSNESTFTIEELSDYLMSQSNMISAVREGKEQAGPLRERLADSLIYLFENPEETFEFSGYIVYLQRVREDSVA